MKKIIFILLFLLSIPTFSIAMDHKLIVSYWSDGPLYKNYPIKNNADLNQKISDINVLAYAFMQVDKNGHIYFQYPLSDLSESDVNGFCKSNSPFCQNVKTTRFEGNFDAFSKLNNKQHNLQKIISIGGSTSDATLNNALNHPNKFVKSAKTIIQYYHLNGIDLDFEPSGLFSKIQSDQYAFLVNLLRKQLEKTAYISIELPGDNETLNSLGRK